MVRSRFSQLLAVFLISAAAHFSPSNGNAAAPKASGCSVSYSEPWNIPASRGQNAKRLIVRATSTGRTCASAGLVFNITNASGQSLFRETYEAQYMMLTSEARTRTQMRVALTEWVISSRDDGFIAGLPNWLAGAETPIQSEFPFTPKEGMKRQQYLAIKAARLPSRCFVQGIESLNCVIYRNGRIEHFGVQSFPG